ncbi:hypothetical protein AT6N2_C2915 [Agrobacterium tumefaciens]|nr:hypothetical protein AT6N2_C2915 [Agrobacterium tumefaciens]
MSLQILISALVGAAAFPLIQSAFHLYCNSTTFIFPMSPRPVAQICHSCFGGGTRFAEFCRGLGEAFGKNAHDLDRDIGEVRHQFEELLLADAQGFHIGGGTNGRRSDAVAQDGDFADDGVSGHFGDLQGARGGIDQDIHLAGKKNIGGIAHIALAEQCIASVIGDPV